MSEIGPGLAIAPEEFRRLGYRAVDLATEHLAGLRERPVYQPMTPAQRQGLMEQPLPETAMPVDALLADVERRLERIRNRLQRATTRQSPSPTTVATVAGDESGHAGLRGSAPAAGR